MRAYKKYLKTLGHRFDEDYPSMPVREPSMPVLEGVRCWYDEEIKCITVAYFYVVGTHIEHIYADGHSEFDFD